MENKKQKLLEKVLELSKEHLEIEKQFMCKFDYIIPSMLVFSYCPNCNQINSSLYKMDIQIELLRKVFYNLLKQALTDTIICRKCKSVSIILGYSYVSEGWMLETSKKEEEFPIYYKAVGTLAKHPQRKEVVLNAVSTSLGETCITTEDVVRGKSLSFANRK